MIQKTNGFFFRALCCSLSIVQIFALCFWIRKSRNEVHKIAFVGPGGLRKGEVISVSKFDFLGSVPLSLAGLYFREEDSSLLTFSKAARDIRAGSALMIYDLQDNSGGQGVVEHIPSIGNAGELRNKGRFEIVGSAK